MLNWCDSCLTKSLLFLFPCWYEFPSHRHRLLKNNLLKYTRFLKIDGLGKIFGPGGKYTVIGWKCMAQSWNYMVSYFESKIDLKYTVMSRHERSKYTAFRVQNKQTVYFQYMRAIYFSRRYSFSIKAAYLQPGPYIITGI